MFAGSELDSSLGVLGSPIGRWEIDLPEAGRGGIEFKRDVESFGGLPRRARHFAVHALFRAAVFEHQMGFGGQILFHYHDRALWSHAQRGRIQRGRFPLQGDVNVGANTEQDALSSLSFLARNRRIRGRCWR
jgi:hypothetical protein